AAVPRKAEEKPAPVKKKCPSCGMEVPLTEKTCPICNHDFEGKPPEEKPPATPPAAEKPATAPVKRVVRRPVKKVVKRPIQKDE
ncbi:MAG: hypothetical protein KAX31_00215, partial [Thermoplasmata archaeon]|nr:hypothetical protein [Thermoplasmata archaeon]